jgi:transposase-like protein
MLARYGATHVQIAKELEISATTLTDWKRQHESLRETIREGMFEFDTDKVEKSLLKRALGYTITETLEKERLVDKASGKTELKIVSRSKKHLPADVTAAIFWLKTRRKDLWRTPPDPIDLNIKYSDLSEEEIDRRIAELLTKGGLGNVAEPA